MSSFGSHGDWPVSTLVQSPAAFESRHLYPLTHGWYSSKTTTCLTTNSGNGTLAAHKSTGLVEVGERV